MHSALLLRFRIQIQSFRPFSRDDSVVDMTSSTLRLSGADDVFSKHRIYSRASIKMILLPKFIMYPVLHGITEHKAQGKAVA